MIADVVDPAHRTRDRASGSCSPRLVADSVIATAVQYELDHDTRALSMRLEALSSAVRVVAAGA